MAVPAKGVSPSAEREIVEQTVHAERGIDAGLVHFADDRNVLRRVLGDEDGNLRVFEEASVDELLANQILRVPGLEPCQVNRAHQRQNYVSGVAYA